MADSTDFVASFEIIPTALGAKLACASRHKKSSYSFSI